MQRILIIGGGAAGVSVATSLSQLLDPSSFTLQLVTERTFHVHYPALIRASVTKEGNFDESAFNPYDKLFQPGKAGEIITGEVTSLRDGSAHLSDGRTLPYDYLVLATGTRWEGPLALPFDREETRRWLSSWQKKFASARSIVLLGGGAVGFELSGELRHYLPDKKVTLIHNGDMLLNATYPTNFRRNIQQALEAKGVNVVLNDRADIPTEKYTSITTKNGVHVETDLVVPTRGGKLNTAFISTLDPSIITPGGAVKVLPTFQVPLTNGRTNVYALGDIIDWPEQKSLAKVPSHAAVVAANILSSIKGQAPKKQYGGSMEAILLPLGPTGGRGYLPLLWGVSLGDFMTRTLKSKTLFVEMARKTVRAT